MDIYNEHCQSNRQGQYGAASLSQKMETWMHRQVSSDLVDSDCSMLSTLEIGAGILNHLVYEKDVKKYDIIEPQSDRYKNSDQLQRVQNIYRDIEDVPFDQHYDRILSIAVFEHIPNLPQVIARSALLLKSTGSLRVAIPSEGTLLWWLGWRLTTGIEFYFKFGLDYGRLMSYEHINTANEIEWLLNHFFENVKSRCLGLPKSLSVYQYFECKNPKKHICDQYISNLKGGFK
jgi:2-polyprenyl-3-methyl-5-hydroxy-6-metoxy-1,4-benzoquinol methylase